MLLCFSEARYWATALKVPVTFRFPEVRVKGVRLRGCGFTKFCGDALTSVRGVPGETPGALSFPYFFGRAKKYGPVRAGQNEKVCLKLYGLLLTSPFALCRRHRRQGLQPMPTQRFGFQQPISRHFTQFIAGDYFLFSCNFCVRIGSRHCRPKEVGKKGNKKRGLRIATIRSPPLFEITPARRAYRSGGAIFVSASAVASSLQGFPAGR